MPDHSSSTVNRDLLVSRGWCQGSILPSSIENHTQKLTEIRRDEHDFFFILSQDCNVLSDSYEKEPFVEVLCAHSVPSPNKMMLNGRNPREYHFSLSDEEPCRHYRILASERECLNRRDLESASPSGTIPKSDIKQIAIWMALRYTRESFPDELNRRFQQLKKKNRDALKNIRKLLEDSSVTDTILDFYLDTQDEELTENKKYDLTIHVEIKPEIYQDIEKGHKSLN